MTILRQFMLHGRWQPLTTHSKGTDFHTSFTCSKHFPETGLTRPWQPQKMNDVHMPVTNAKRKRHPHCVARSV